MRQQDYETIVKCIQYGAPALAQDLYTSFNEVIKLSNERTVQLQEEQRRKVEAETKRHQEEKAKQESKDSKVVNNKGVK